MPRGGRGQLPVHRQAGVSTDIRTAGRNRSRCRGSRVFASHTGHRPPQGDRACPRAQRSARPCPCFVGRNARPDNHRDLKRSGMCSLAFEHFDAPPKLFGLGNHERKPRRNCKRETKARRLAAPGAPAPRCGAEFRARAGGGLPRAVSFPGLVRKRPVCSCSKKIKSIGLSVSGDTS